MNNLCFTLTALSSRPISLLSASNYRNRMGLPIEVNPIETVQRNQKGAFSKVADGISNLRSGRDEQGLVHGTVLQSANTTDVPDPALISKKREVLFPALSK
jgi:hypothetical protein